MWSLQETINGSLMLLIGFILIIIARRLALFFRQDDIDLSKINDVHSWSELDILLKTYSCQVCDNCLTGNCGKQCDNCGICCHYSCIQIAAKTVRCKDVYLSGEKRTLNHHWIDEGNLILDCARNDEIFCYVCDDECVDDENNISRCCWCQKIKHSACSPHSNDCDFGKYREFIIPPFCVTLTKPNRLYRKFNVKCFSHPGWEKWSPVFVLANRRAGNSEGAYVLSQFRRHLNPCQILDLAVHSPSLLVKWCSVIPADVTLYIIVAGGDGTIAWVLNTLNQSANIPPIAIIPLGTGNDLSRVLGWGTEYNKGQSVTSYLDKISRSITINLDRWCVRIKSLNNISLPRAVISYYYNYLSVGVDAKVALDFHHTRQTSSLYLSNRLYNKLLYAVFGTRQVVAPDCSGLQKRIKLYLDGIEITSIPEIESIVIVNIPSWAAGVTLWNHEADPVRMLPQRIDDGKLEVIGIYSSFHIAQLQIGLSEPYYIGQASEVKIILLEKLPIQTDGEPWIQKPGEVVVSLCNKAKVLKVQEKF